jgi:hypothetical protein
MENGIEDDYQDMEPAMPRHDFDDNFFQMEDMLIPGMLKPSTPPFQKVPF